MWNFNRRICFSVYSVPLLFFNKLIFTNLDMKITYTFQIPLKTVSSLHQILYPDVNDSNSSIALVVLESHSEINILYYNVQSLLLLDCYQIHNPLCILINIITKPCSRYAKNILSLVFLISLMCMIQTRIHSFV